MYFISREFFRIILLFFGRLKILGRENVPSKGGLIVAPNHVSFLDPPVTGMGVNRLVRFIAKQELFDAPVFGKWMYAIGSFPVRRGTADRRAIKNALDCLERGEVLGIFPEGRRSPNGELQEPELGIGLFALKSKVPVVPLAIIGTDKVLPPGAKLPHFAKVVAIYGKPMTFPDLYDSPSSREAFQEVGKRIMTTIAEMKADYLSGRISW